jgi:hypothetical protein
MCEYCDASSDEENFSPDITVKEMRNGLYHIDLVLLKRHFNFVGPIQTAITLSFMMMKIMEILKKILLDSSLLSKRCPVMTLASVVRKLKGEKENFLFARCFAL